MYNSYKNYILALSILAFSVSCTSVKKFNSQIDKPKSPDELRADVDYVYKKLQKLHPSLYWYISKKDLDYKFDSLKATITTPMTSNEFYFKLSPIVASVKQGHMRLSYISKRQTKKEIKSINKKGLFPLSQLTYEVLDNKLYITKNLSNDTTIKVGSEIVNVNGIKPQDIFSKFSKAFASDGFNTTLNHRFYSWQFPNYFYLYTNQRDSVNIQLRIKDSLTVANLVHGAKKKTDETSKKDSVVKVDKKLAKLKAKNESKKKRLQGYNPQNRTYSKELNFVGSDSSIALVKINDFSRGDYKKFYKNTFYKLDSLKTQALIIDIRDNPGGKLKEVSNLYSYLTDSNFVFIDKMEVTSRTSFVLGSISNTTPIVVKALTYTIGLPFLIGRMAKIEKKDGKFYYRISDSKSKKPNVKNFKGKVYVLINGGSFSATSIISSNLKATKRAIFVGEETGGAFNGCVAGTMPVYTLPKSKLKLRLGLAVIKPYYKTDIDGRGIFPDMPIIPTANDLLTGNDPELKWVIDDIEGKH